MSEDVKWTRHGECDSCGHCCRVIATVDLQFETSDPDWRRVRGIPDSMIKRLHVIDPCSQLGPYNTCKIYPDRPQHCRDFPQTPEMVAGQPCTYWFESDTGERVGGLRSPYPTEAA